MGTPPNPALLIGLRLTPVSSICFCLKRALQSHSLQEGHGKQITSHAKKVETSQCSQDEVLIRTDLLVITIPSKFRGLFTKNADIVTIQEHTGASSVALSSWPSALLSHAGSCQVSIPRLKHCACLLPPSPNDCLSVRSFLVLLNQRSDHRLKRQT